MYRTTQKQMSMYDYLPPGEGALNQTNRWVRLARELDWDVFEQAYSGLFSAGGKVALPARLALGCRIIQVYYALPDREVVELVRESPYLQYFLGQEIFSQVVPFSQRSVARFRQRIPDRAVRPAVRLLHSYNRE